VESGSRLPSIKILFCICIKSGADALANLPNLGKVVPARGCGHFGNETGRANVSLPRETGGGFCFEVARHTRSGNLSPTCQPVRIAELAKSEI
jgi:hypothetical protein